DGIRDYKVTGVQTCALPISQIDVTGGVIAPAPVQQQIYQPDATLNRWMGSIAADRLGNVALGYSTSNETAPNYPSIAYSGRLAKIGRASCRERVEISVTAVA